MASTETKATQETAPIRALPLADPGSLGLGAFAMTTFFLSCVNAGWVPASVEPGVLGLALFYGGIAQLLAGMWEFAKGNTFGATAFGSFGAFWLSFWYLLTHVDLAGMGGDASIAVGLYLVGWAIFTGYMMIASFGTTGAVAAVFVTLFVTYVLLAIGELAGAPNISIIGGYVGVLTALVAWYASFATVANSAHKRTVLPVWPR